MPNLRELLAAHAPLLLIDAASTRVQVGVFAADGSARWAASETEAGIGIFQCIDRLQVELPAIRGFAFCDGPGSMLGVRTAATALRTWCVLSLRPVFAYHSLAVVAAALRRPDVHFIADARRDSWHVVGTDRALRRVPTSELSGELVMPDGFRNWTPLPAGVASTPYTLEKLLPAVMDEDLFRATEAPDAFLHEAPSYVRWTPQIHRAP
ncbi:MAG: hypothetical protein JWM32_2399 [Verrucomicrobia bacterium]|nr:hypothetical protein [Verrucomicrobiota bacterium]